MHPGDGDHFAVFDGSSRPPAQLTDVPSLAIVHRGRRLLLAIRPCAKRMPPPGKHRNPVLGLPVQSQEQIPNLANHPLVMRIARLGPVQPDPQRLAVRLQLDGLQFRQLKRQQAHAAHPCPAQGKRLAFGRVLLQDTQRPHEVSVEQDVERFLFSTPLFVIRSGRSNQSDLVDPFHLIW